MYIATNPHTGNCDRDINFAGTDFKLFRETVYLIVVGILGLMYHNLT